MTEATESSGYLVGHMLIAMPQMQGGGPAAVQAFHSASLYVGTWAKAIIITVGGITALEHKAWSRDTATN